MTLVVALILGAYGFSWAVLSTIGARMDRIEDKLTVLVERQDRRITDLEQWIYRYYRAQKGENQ